MHIFDVYPSCNYILNREFKQGLRERDENDNAQLTSSFHAARHQNLWNATPSFSSLSRFLREIGKFLVINYESIFRHDFDNVIH